MQHAGGVMQQSSSMLMLGETLALLESVRHLCDAVEIPIPGIVVTGSQSAGKSSLLEAISGIQLPRGDGTCTRMPCVLTLVADPNVATSYALVSTDSTYADSAQIPPQEVEKKVEWLTKKHTQGTAFISKDPIYVKVVSPSGPQMSLIDLPGLAHISEKMPNIHSVTKELVEKYMKKEEMIILCVVPGIDDFCNAEVIKMAQEHDPNGQRTLGVVTKCSAAAKLESDVVDKVLMRREDDIKLRLGFHCVSHRSQTERAQNLSHEEMIKKEIELFEADPNFNKIYSEQARMCGTLNLTERIAKIQASHVQSFLPKIQTAVRSKLKELNDEINTLPRHFETDEEQRQCLESVLREVRRDLERRARAEYIGSKPEDKGMTIAPQVARMTSEFREDLMISQPNFLSDEWIDKVEDAIQNFAVGFSVDNLVGQGVFDTMVKDIYVKEGMLSRHVNELIDKVVAHLHPTILGVIELHGNNPAMVQVMMQSAREVIDDVSAEAKQFCGILVAAQDVTSTTHRDLYSLGMTEAEKEYTDTRSQDQACDDYLMVSGSSAQSEKMGVYVKTEVRQCGRPVYKQSSGATENYLFFWEPNRFWLIGPDYLTNRGGVVLSTGTGKDFSSPVGVLKWQHYDGSSWTDEDGINVVAQGEMKSGCSVEVLVDFQSDNKTPVMLRKGLNGRVVKIDGDGGAHVHFGSIDAKAWVLQKNYSKLRVLPEARNKIGLEVCKSLHAYTGIMIPQFVDTVAKVVRKQMVDDLTEKIETKWRKELFDKLNAIFIVDSDTALRRTDLESKRSALRTFDAKIWELTMPQKGMAVRSRL